MKYIVYIDNIVKCVHNMKHIILELSEVADECIAEMKKNQEIEMSEDDEFDFENATCCHTCKTDFGEKGNRVRDHYHRI